MDNQPLVPISALEHHVYCPRQCALIYVDGLWMDNQHTVRGTAHHQRVDSGAHRIERGRHILRAIPLWSEELGLTGRADVVEVTSDGNPVPVEYKIGTLHLDAVRVQLCAQALCLEEMVGRPVRAGFVWLSVPRRRIIVRFDRDLRAETVAAVQEVRGWMQNSHLPPAPNDQRCSSCQFLDHCQPDLTANNDAVRTYLRTMVRCAC